MFFVHEFKQFMHVFFAKFKCYNGRKDKSAACLLIMGMAFYAGGKCEARKGRISCGIRKGFTAACGRLRQNTMSERVYANHLSYGKIIGRKWINWQTEGRQTDRQNAYRLADR